MFEAFYFNVHGDFAIQIERAALGADFFDINHSAINTNAVAEITETGFTIRNMQRNFAWRITATYTENGESVEDVFYFCIKHSLDEQYSDTNGWYVTDCSEYSAYTRRSYRPGGSSSGSVRIKRPGSL